MRRTLNLNVSVELCDNDNLTMTVREAAGSLSSDDREDDGPQEDTVVYMATLQYDPTLEMRRSMNSLVEFLEESMARWLDSATESIALEQEKWAKSSPVKRAFQKQAGPEWACPNCGVVNCDEVCEDCGSPSPWHVKLGGAS